MEIGGSMLSSLSLTGSDGIVRTSGNQVVRGVKNFVDGIITPLVYEPTGDIVVLAVGGDVNIGSINNISLSNNIGINTVDSVSGSNVLSIGSVSKITTTSTLNTIQNKQNKRISDGSSTNAYAPSLINGTMYDSALTQYSVFIGDAINNVTAATYTVGSNYYQNGSLYFYSTQNGGTGVTLETLGAGTDISLTATGDVVIYGDNNTLTAANNNTIRSTSGSNILQVGGIDKLTINSTATTATVKMIAPNYNVGTFASNKPLVSNFRHINTASMSLGTDILLGIAPFGADYIYGMSFPVNVKIWYIKLVSTIIATGTAQTMRYAGYKNGALVIFDNSAVTSVAASAYGQFFTLDVSSFNVTLTPTDYYYHTLGGTVASAPSLNWNAYVYYQQI